MMDMPQNLAMDNTTSADIRAVMQQLDHLMNHDPGLPSAQHKRWKRELLLKLKDLQTADRDG